MNVEELQIAIVSGAYDKDFNRIEDAIKIRKLATRANLSVGTKVTLTNISPKYMVGLTGTITGKLKTTATVALDRPELAGRFSQGSIVRVPMNCLEEI